MSKERDRLKLEVDRSAAAVARAQKVYDEAEPGSVKDSRLQHLRAEEASLLAHRNALDQKLDLWEQELHLRECATAGMG